MNEVDVRKQAYLIGLRHAIEVISNGQVNALNEDWVAGMMYAVKLVDSEVRRINEVN